MKAETYYAIRVGDPRYHLSYLMVRPDDPETPWLFLTKAQAQQQLDLHAGPCCKVVRVRIKPQ